MDYRSWLAQCTPQPYLQTVDPDDTLGARVFYPTGNLNTIPVLRMGFQVTTGVSGAVLGFFRINARYTVRGRRGVPLGLSQRLTAEEKMEVYHAVMSSMLP